MGRTVPEGIQKFTETEPGNYNAQIVALEERPVSVSGEDVKRLTYSLQLKILEPQNRAGRMHFETFWIGTTEDPLAQMDETWQANAGRLMVMCEAAGVPFVGEDIDNVMARLPGAVVSFTAEKSVSKKPPYKTYVNITKWWPIGSIEPGLHHDERHTEAAPKVPTSHLPPGPAVAIPQYPPQTSPQTSPQDGNPGNGASVPSYIPQRR